MLFSDYRFLLDVHDINSQISLSFKQGDTGRILYITLTEGGNLFSIPESCVAVFTAMKPDGTIIFNDCEIVNNEIRYTITEQTTLIPGKVDCELRLYGKGNTLITSPHFTIFCHPTVYADKIVESHDEVNTLTGLIYEASSKLANGDFVPKLAVGSVATLPAGSNATVDIAGTAENPVLNFGIPQGDEGQAESLVPDTELSTSSTKPVQNKVITEAINALEQNIAESTDTLTAAIEKVDSDNAEALNTLAEEVETNKSETEATLDTKVDKVPNMGLSQNDFTDAYRAKLAGIEAGANKFVLEDGAVKAANISDELKTQYFPVYVLNNWEGEAAPYTHTATVNGLLATDRPKVFFVAPDNFADLEADQEAFALLYDVDSANGSVTFYAKEKPDVEFSVMLEVSRI